MYGSQDHSTTRGEESFLEQLDAMRGEVSSSMLAISGNSLKALEESLWRQEVLCVSLNRLLESLDRRTVEPSSVTLIQTTTAALHKLNQSYAALVEQAETSAGTLYRLCRDYKDSQTSLGDGTSLSSYSLEA